MSEHRDGTTTAEERPAPPKPFRLNRKTVLLAGTSGIAVLFLAAKIHVEAAGVAQAFDMT